MLSMKLTIAERAQKSPASVAGEHGLFLRMIEATGFSLHHEGFPVAASGHWPKKCREDFDLQRRAAVGAGSQFGLVEGLKRCQRRPAFRTVQQRQIHTGRLT